MKKRICMIATGGTIASQANDTGLAPSLRPEDISEDLVSARLYSAGIPDPDLMIRPGGELRLSNFLLWQNAYSEFYFTDTLWPDMNEAELDRAIAVYQRRKRRYGGI